MIPLLDLASLSSGTILLPALVPSILQSFSLIGRGATSTRRVQSRLIVVVASSQSVGYQSRWELPCHYLDLVPLTLFPEFADMEV